MNGDTSTAIRTALRQKETESQTIADEAKAQSASAPKAPSLPSRQWIQEKLEAFGDLLNSVPAEIQCSRLELKNLLGSKIVMNPVGNGRNGHYVAEVKGKPLNILRPHLHPLMVSSSTGNRTVSDTWVEVKIVLPGRFRVSRPQRASPALAA